MTHFENFCQKAAYAPPSGYSELLNIQFDFLYWYQVQNLFQSYFSSLNQNDTPSLDVLSALKQTLARSVNLEFFALTDSLIILASQCWKKEGTNWRVLTEIFKIFDELQENLAEQKVALRFIDHIDICLNLTLFCASSNIEQLIKIVQNNVMKGLQWIITTQRDTPSFFKLESDLKQEFNVSQVTTQLIEFILCAFKTLLRDRSYGYTFDPNHFISVVLPAQIVPYLVKIIKNENNCFDLETVLHCLQILDGLSCIDLVKEFKDITDQKKNPYFKEACKHFNTYAQILRTFALTNLQNQTTMEVDEINPSQTLLKSQRFLFIFLLFIQSLVEMKTRDMQNTLYVQIVEPIVQIFTVQPHDGIYFVDLACQEAALLILKTITKKSHIFDDSNLLMLIINRLKTELNILGEDLTGQVNRWRSNKPQNDLEFDSCSMERRQKFIKDTLGFLCYSIIRMDPTQVAQQQNFVAHSRKILESNLFEECLMELVFLKNENPPNPLYEKVIDPIFMECVQLYTYLGNDLPQKLGELIDCGLINCILDSLSRRIPVQTNLVSVIIKFFKMLNLNAKGTEALLKSQAIERFFELSLDYRSYKMFVMPRGSNLMFDQRQLVHNFSNENLEISERIYSQCIKNLEICYERAWLLCYDFFKMEKDIANLPTDQEKDQYRDIYGKKQLNFEQTLESSAALLSCFCMDEIEYIENLSTHRSFVSDTIKKRNISDLILKILRTPIICSAADLFIYHFQESATLILMMQSGLDGFKVYLNSLKDFFSESFQDLYAILDTNDLNNLCQIEAVNFVDLSEHQATHQQKESLKQLKIDDVAWVAISKIHMLIEMVIILGTLSKYHEKLEILPLYNEFLDQMLESKIGGYQCIQKLQALLNRYYANVYIEQVKAQELRRNTVLEKYRGELTHFLWKSYRESDEPYSELEDAKNIYYRYEVQTVDSLTDKKVDDLTRYTFEFVLPEVKGVMQTFKCYKKIKNLMGQLQAVYNKRRYHFKDAMTPQQVAFNEINATYIADQLRHIASRCTANTFSIDQTLTTALLIDRLLPELSRQINFKWKNQLNGLFLFNLLNQEQIVDVIGVILEWAMKQYDELENQQGKKCLFYARNIQIIVRECIQFYLGLLKLTYLCNGNLHTFLTYFRRDKGIKQSQKEVEQLFDKCFVLTKNLLFKCALIPIVNVLFSQSRTCHLYLNYFTGQISENITKIYSTLCLGGFKEPIDFFGDINIHRQQIQQNLSGILRYMHRHVPYESSDDDSTMIQQINDDYVAQLVSMGFKEQAAKAALRSYHNDFNLAIDALIRGEFANLPEIPPVNPLQQPEQQNAEILQQSNQIVEQIPDFTNKLMFEDEFGSDNELEIMEQICKLIGSTFIQCVTKSLQKAPIGQLRPLISKLFQFYKENQKVEQQKAIVQNLIYNLANEMVQLNLDRKFPDWFFVCFTIQILSFSKEEFVQKMNLHKIIEQLIFQMKSQTQNIAIWTKTKLKNNPQSIEAINEVKQNNSQFDQQDEKIIDECNTSLYAMHSHLSLLYFLLTDFLSQQDLTIINKLIMNGLDPNEDKSAFEETITFKDVEEIKKDVLLKKQDSESKEPFNLIEDENIRCQISKMTYEAVMMLLQSFTNVEFSLVANLKRQIQFMLQPAVKILKQLSMLQFADFDFRAQFTKENGIKKLFEMNIIDREWQAKKSYWEITPSLEQDLHELMENLWNTPRELQKWYEGLIQRQLFYQFKANYKRLSEEGKLQKDVCEYLIAGHENQWQNKQIDIVPSNEQDYQVPVGAQGSQTKTKKNNQQQQQVRKNKSNGKQVFINKLQEPNQDHDESKFLIPSQKDIKRLVKKYEELNEQNFSEFVKYYNSNIFGHVIVHFGVFLAACAKVCVIKKVPKTQQLQAEEEESKEAQFDLKIMIKKQVLKDMLIDPNFNYVIPPPKIQLSKLNPQVKQNDTPKFQTEIINQLLEMFIHQAKGYRMEILKQLRENQSANLQDIITTNSSILEVNQGKICLKMDASQERRIYFFDHVSILRALTTIISRNNGTVSFLHKHNDSKTIKFIFRNIYYLIAMNIQGGNTATPTEVSRELQLNLVLPNERQFTVISFFIHVLLNNFSSSQAEKAVKRELTGIFIRQIAKNLTFIPTNESIWANSNALMNKFSAIWFIARFLTMRGPEETKKDAAAVISQKKAKYLRLQRTQIVKQLIIQCNQLQQPSNQVFSDSLQINNFALLESIQNLSISLKKHDLYLFGQSKNSCLSICVSVITKVLRLFENSQSLGQFFKQLGSKPEDYSSSANGDVIMGSDLDEVMLHDEAIDSSSEYDSMGDDIDEDGEDDEGEEDDEDDDGDDNFHSRDGSLRNQNSLNINLMDFISQNNHHMLDDDNESAEYDEEDEEEASWDDFNHESVEEEQEENVQINCDGQQQQVTENQAIVNKTGAGNNNSQSSNQDDHPADDGSEEVSDGDEDNSWDEYQNASHLNQEQISYQSDSEQSFVEQNGEFDEYSEMEDDDSMNSREGLSYHEEEDSHDHYGVGQLESNPNQRINRIDRRAYILSQNAFIGNHHPRQINLITSEFQIPSMFSQEYYNLDENGLNRQQPPTSNIQRILQENAGLLPSSFNDQFMNLLNDRLNLRDGNKDCNFITAINQRKQQIQQLKERVKLTEGFYKLHITTFVATENHPQIQIDNGSRIQNTNQNQIAQGQTNSVTADSSDMHVHNPIDFKGHMTASFQRQLPQLPNIPNPQRQTQNRAQNNSNQILSRIGNPLEIEGMDPLFMESLSAIGLQNIADSHQIHAQLTNQNQLPLVNGQTFEIMQDLLRFLRAQPQQRRQDILRQIQNDMCRDIPSEIFAEARELYRSNREELIRLFNTSHQNQSQILSNPLANNQQQQRLQQQNINNNNIVDSLTQTNRNREQHQPMTTRNRLISQDSFAISLDLHGPADLSQNAQNDQIPKPNNIDQSKQQPVEMIRGDQFVQNFFVILQDMNSRYERDPHVSQIDRQSELILQNSLIPMPNDNAIVQYQKIKGTVQTAQTAFMNLNIDQDQYLMQSIKILHRIPNIRICLVLNVLKQAQDELIFAKKHCQEQIENLKCQPYETKLIFSENITKENMFPFVNIIVGAFRTTTQLMTTIENSSTENQIPTSTFDDKIEVINSIQANALIQKFGQLINLQETDKSILECLIDLQLDFWQLCNDYPWVIPETDSLIQIDIQNHIIESIHNLVVPIMKEAKQKDVKLALPLQKMCQVFLDRQQTLSKKSLQQVSATLNEFTDPQSTEIIQRFMEQKVSVLLEKSMKALMQRLQISNQGSELSNFEIDSNYTQRYIEQTSELFKIANGVSKLKTCNICEESLLLQIFDQARQIVLLEEKKADNIAIKDDKHNLFFFREEVKDIMLLLFSLCEYNLRLIFSKKNESKATEVVSQQNIIMTDSQHEMQIETVEKREFVAKKSDEPQTFDALLESHLSPKSPDFKRFKTTLSFFVENRKLINTFIQLNSQVINKELIQVALMIPQVLDFDTKRVIWKVELKRLQSKYKNERFNFQIRREHTLSDSYAVLNSLSLKQWRGNMQIEFQGEDGVDGGGLFKEWLSIMSKEILNEDMALFIKSASGSTYYPNPQSTVQSNYIDMFTFVGKIFGKSLWDLQLLDCYFVKAFYKILLGIPLSYHDLEDYDSDLYKSLNWMIENQGVESICSSFVETIEYFGEQKEIELCEGGKDKIVTDENKFDYVQLVANYRLYKAISTQIDAFLKGFYSIVPKDLLKIFDNRELELLISGLQVIDIDDLRENTVYQNYTASSKPIQYLFEALQEFDNLERAEFIRFVTGSSKVPVEGFKGLRGANGIQKFTVVKIPSTTQTRLPQSHTCHNQLDLPEYQSKDITKRMLLYAIKEGKTFGFA